MYINSEKSSATNLVLFDDIEGRVFIASLHREITAKKVEHIEIQENPNSCEELLAVGITFREINAFVTADHTRENCFKDQIRNRWEM